jgi:imidazole glycerol-phosphate synthase subunit HisH
MKNKILTVGIIDLKFNNLFSIHKACTKAGFRTSIISTKQKTLKYDFVIIPGVGAFKSGMNIIKKNNYDEKIYNYLLKPNSFIYGICLGMQLLFEKSFEFGSTKGLGLIEGNVPELHKKNREMKTNMGWCKTKFIKRMSKSNLKEFDNKHFYFVHSYYADPSNMSDILAKTSHGNFTFTSVVKKNNILGTQFHPEKSGNLGIDFLKNLKKFKN